MGDGNLFDWLNSLNKGLPNDDVEQDCEANGNKGILSVEDMVASKVLSRRRLIMSKGLQLFDGKQEYDTQSCGCAKLPIDPDANLYD
jgi:hypothetical protein